MERKQSNKWKLQQKKTFENNNLECSRISSISEGEEKYPENSEEDSVTFRDYYDEYVYSRNTSQSTNRDVYSSCDDHSDPEGEIVKDTKKMNRTKTSKKERSRRSSRSGSPKRSLSRKGSKRSSPRRNKKSREVQRDKSPNKHGSQRRKPERVSSRNTRKSTGSNRFRSLVKTRIWIPKTHDGNPKTNDELDTSEDSDSETWKETESELSTSSKTKHEPCDADTEVNEEPKRICSNENTQKQNCEATEKINKRNDKKVKYSSIKSKTESNVSLQLNDGFCEENLHERKNWPRSHDENREKDSEDEKGSASSLHSSHTYTPVQDEKSVSNLPMTEKCEEIKTLHRKKELNRRKHERKRKTKDEVTMTEEILFSVGPHQATNENPPGNNTNSNRGSSHYDSSDAQLDCHDSDTELDHCNSAAQPDHHDKEQPDDYNNEALSDPHSNEVQPDHNDSVAQPDRYDNEAQPNHHNNETQSVSSAGSGHLERLCAKYGVGSDSSDSSRDDSEDAEESPTEDSTHVTSGKEELENDSNNNEKPQRKRSVTFAEAIPVIESETKETTEELVSDDVDKLAAELTALTDENNVAADQLQKQRDEFKDEIHRLHTELMRFKTQCQKEAEKCHAELEKKKAKLREEYEVLEEKEQQQEKNKLDTVDKLTILAAENNVLKRKQKLLDMDDTLIEKEEELSKRSKELENYEKEIDEIEGFLNRRHDLTKRKEAEILELDEELSRLKESLRIQRATVETELGVDSEMEESRKKAKENWELIKETIDTRALTMQSTVKKYKADLATAENTVTDLNQKVNSLEDQLAKREHKVKELESQLSLTLSQVINNNREKVPITFDDSSGCDPSPTLLETVSTNISVNNSRRPSTSSGFQSSNATSSFAPKGSRASLTPKRLRDPNSLKPRWSSTREPRAPERPQSDNKSTKYGWRPVSRTLSDSAFPVPTPQSSNHRGSTVVTNGHDSPNGNPRSNACVIS